jgi:hypothetical protein
VDSRARTLQPAVRATFPRTLVHPTAFTLDALPALVEAGTEGQGPGQNASAAVRGSLSGCLPGFDKEACRVRDESTVPKDLLMEIP